MGECKKIPNFISDAYEFINLFKVLEYTNQYDEESHINTTIQQEELMSNNHPHIMYQQPSHLHQIFTQPSNKLFYWIINDQHKDQSNY